MRHRELNLHATLKQIRYFWIQGLDTMDIAKKLNTSEGQIWRLLDSSRDIKNSGRLE